MNARNRRVGRLAIELRWRRDLQQPAAVHHRDAVGQRHRFGLVVRDVDHRRAGARVEAGELVFHRRAQMHVEVGQRLVEQHQRGLGDQAARERHALALTAGQQRWPALGVAFELDQRERRLDAPRALRVAHARDRQAVGDVLGDGHVRPQRVRLEDDADAAPLGRHVLRAAETTVSPMTMRPRVELVEAGDLPQQASSCRSPTGPESP